jgi:predicted DsbA family dithiol-disulfide isomerase
VKSRYWLLVVRVCSLFAVLVSAALLMHYVAPEDSTFCGARSGCEAVRKSDLVKGLPPYAIPGLGVAGYLGIFWLSFSTSLKPVLRWAGALGGVLALGFIMLQAVGIGAFCWMCVIVDALAIVIAFACVAMTNHAVLQWDPLKGWGWFLLAGLALNTPAIWVNVKPNDSIPASILRVQEPGVLNVIEFVDFECPHCRRLHPAIKANLAALDVPVKFQRFHVPLPFHIHAEGAARAGVCAKTLGKEEEMADLLFSQPVRKDVWLEHARTLGLEERAFRECLDADATTETLADHFDLFQATGSRGLPLTFIGRETLRGAPDPSVVRETFQKALTPERSSVPAPLFLALMAAFVVLVAWFFRKPVGTDTPAAE